MNNKIIWIFRFTLGVLFILSAISKLFPIEAFDLAIVNQGIAGWKIAPYLSRLIISIELFIGISFFITPFIKRIAVPFSFLLLIVFCFHLIFLIITGHASKNCGCFGELIPMSSLEALFKNIALIILILFIQKYFSSSKTLNYSVAFSAYAIVFAGVFLFFQIKPYKIPQALESTKLISDSSAINNLRKGQTDVWNGQTKAESDTTSNDGHKKVKDNYEKKASLFAGFTDFNGSQRVNLDEGIKLVCLFSLDCEDCMETAHKLGQVRKEWNNFPPMFVLFLGEEEQVNIFFDAAATTFPYKIISPQSFFPLIKDYPPRIVLLRNGNILGDWSYESFSTEELRQKLK
ncbi:MAG: hypothetical protein HXY50_13985 [Ignavibacteriaceae bacterium]|nr:hypothetical protein [Ignavibacteriaceae bacterium]